MFWSPTVSILFSWSVVLDYFYLGRALFFLSAKAAYVTILYFTLGSNLPSTLILASTLILLLVDYFRNGCLLTCFNIQFDTLNSYLFLIFVPFVGKYDERDYEHKWNTTMS